jgi:hypothetical protein
MGRNASLSFLYSPLAGKDVARAACVLKWLREKRSPCPHTRKVPFDNDRERFDVDSTGTTPIDLFNHQPQSVELGQAFHGAYVFAPIVVGTRLIVSRLDVPTESSQAERGNQTGLKHPTSSKPLASAMGFLTSYSRHPLCRSVLPSFQETIISLLFCMSKPYRNNQPYKLFTNLCQISEGYVVQYP